MHVGSEARTGWVDRSASRHTRLEERSTRRKFCLGTCKLLDCPPLGICSSSFATTSSFLQGNWIAGRCQEGGGLADRDEISVECRAVCDWRKNLSFRRGKPMRELISERNVREAGNVRSFFDTRISQRLGVYLPSHRIPLMRPCQDWSPGHPSVLLHVASANKLSASREIEHCASLGCSIHWIVRLVSKG